MVVMCLVIEFKRMSVGGSVVNDVMSVRNMMLMVRKLNLLRIGNGDNISVEKLNMVVIFDILIVFLI